MTYPKTSFLAVMTNSEFPLSQLVNKTTNGTAIPVLSNPQISQLEPSAQLLGTVNNNRGRWNPFLPENSMIREGEIYYKEVELRANGGRYRDGVYAFRFAINHNLQETYKADHYKIDSTGKPKLITGAQANQANNIIVKVKQDGIYKIIFNPAKLIFDITPNLTYLTKIETVQINGFIWDNEDMFQKFAETRPNHEMALNNDWWEITIPLKVNGSFRQDGVYQFLFSVNHNEDWGFAAYNDGQNSLVGGTGFGSSGGQNKHSAITIQVFADGDYRIRINPKKYKFEAIAPEGVQPVKVWNDVKSFQLLGTFYNTDQFTPTNSDRNMNYSQDGVWRKIVNIQPGIYGANFAISQELFLDTMALGAWLESDQTNKLIGRAWHGKPNEPNIFFEVLQEGAYQFSYYGDKDEFYIEYIGEKSGDTVAIKPLITIKTLQLVGNFDTPLESWNPSSEANNLQRIAQSIFTKTVHLEAGRQYEYKYTANNWGWLWVFADYELDGYGQDFTGTNPDPLHSRIEDLKVYGQLTTHGDPPTLKFTPQVSGEYTFRVNLETGAYFVQQN